MKRVIVFGGLGHFGGTIIAELSKFGIRSVAAARRAPAEIRCDAENPISIRQNIRPGDLVIDAAGPFHWRSMALIETAIELGCDVIDINDNLCYAEQVVALEARIRHSGIRVVTSASTVSAVAAAVIHESKIADPIRLHAFLAPATRHTANAGSAQSLLRIVGQPIQIWHDGRLQFATGWTEPRTFEMPPPLGRISARLYESADAFLLPRQWPTLQDVAMYVDSNVRGVNTLLTLASHSAPIRRALTAGVRVGVRAARWLGAKAGGVGYEIASTDGRVVQYSLIANEQGYLTAVAPAILAARAIVGDTFPHVGLVPPTAVCEPEALFSHLHSAGIELRSNEVQP
jgi:hypothetical protein